MSFRHDAEGVGIARRFLADTMAEWGCEQDRNAAALLVSELVTNAIIHARTAVDVTVRCEGLRMTVEVHDHSDVMPAELDASSMALGGRGVRIVAALADDWGVRSVPGDGKVVWFSLTSEAS